MSQGAGRIVCPRCGTNNFDTVSACWKCSAPLGAGGPPPGAPARPSSPSHSSSQGAYSAPAQTMQPMQPQQQVQQSQHAPSVVEGYAYQASAAVSSLGDKAAANRAAFWLGMLFPYFGFPIGLAFIMTGDRQRQEAGRLCILWSTLSGVVHLLLMFVTVLGMRQMFGAFLGGLQAGAGKGGLGGGGLGGGLGGGMDGP